MEKQIINEKDHKNIINGWYQQAKQMTLDKLPEFLKHLSEDYIHDYGTICHSYAAGAIATIWALDHSPQGGITGFQAGCIMWEFIKHWNYEYNKTGLGLTDYDNLLYPQYEDKFEKTIPQWIWDALQKEAKNKLDEVKDGLVHPDVKKHWENIVAGKIPFGFIISED